MVQIIASYAVALLLVAPAMAAPFNAYQNEEIDAREHNTLARRRFHIHLPKIHLPKIHLPKIHIPSSFGKAILGGLKSVAPQFEKLALNAAKTSLQEGMMAAVARRSESPKFVPRDMDSIDELHDLLARSPRRSITRLLKTVKTMKEYAEEHRRIGHFALEAGRVFGRDIEDSEVDSRELVESLEILERALSAEIYERDINDEFEGYERDGNLDTYAEGLLGRDYDEFGLEELD